MCNIRFFFIFIVFSGMVQAQPGTIGSHFENSQLVRDLSGYKWKMKFMLPGEGIKEGLHELPPEDIETLVWNPAHVPGDVYTDSWLAGLIDDPYFGRNSSKAQWVANYEWWYTYQFDVTEDIGNQVIRLDFDGIDYSCDIWLNGHHLGRHEGAFSNFSYDITAYLNTSKHWLKSKNMLTIKLDPPPKVNAKVAGRKTPWFGDYWRDLIPFGIWQPIRMVSTGKTRILDAYANSKEIATSLAKVDLEIEVENTTNVARDIQIISSIEGKNFDQKPVTFEIKRNIPPGKHIIVQPIEVKNPKLWWPWDLGDPNLYTLKISIKEENVNQDFKETSFGIRTVEMAWNPGFTKEEVSLPRTTMINDKFHFIRSAVWGGPPDIFNGRTSAEEYKKLIDLAKEANMNNIRIFGWHPPEIKEFYDYCDEAGITVWQDVVPLGTGNLPKDDAFRDITIAEAVNVIKKRRNHPSLIMIEGGEEMFLRSGDAMFTKKFLETLGDSLHNYVNLPFVPDSPLTDEVSREAGFKSKEAVHALKYFYNMGTAGLMEDWYQTLNYPIVPELAITSVPNVESLKKFIPEDELWPPGLSWGHHWADLDRLRIQNWDAFGDERLGSLEEFVNATQDAQGIIFQLSVEKLRRDKPNLSGVSLCHFITYWPDMKWAIVDNYQVPKRSYYYVQTAYQPLLVNLKFDKRRWKSNEEFKGEIWIVNDYYKRFKDCDIEIIVKSDTGEELLKKTFKNIDIDESSSQKIASVTAPLSADIDRYFYIELFLTNKSGSKISMNDYMLLIGDQENARKEFAKMGEKIRTLNAQYGYGNYYRFFDEVIRKDGKDFQSKTQTPSARNYPKN